jgi:hypothetical protein
MKNIWILAEQEAGEVKTVSFVEKDDGYFLFHLGDTLPLPPALFDHNRERIFLQVDIKTTGQPNSTYEQIDASQNVTRNRRSYSPHPYSRNTDMLDGKHAGYEGVSEGASWSFNKFGPKNKTFAQAAVDVGMKQVLTKNQTRVINMVRGGARKAA